MQSYLNINKMITERVNIEIWQDTNEKIFRFSNHLIFYSAIIFVIILKIKETLKIVRNMVQKNFNLHHILITKWVKESRLIIRRRLYSSKELNALFVKEVDIEEMIPWWL